MSIDRRRSQRSTRRHDAAFSRPGSTSRHGAAIDQPISERARARTASKRAAARESPRSSTSSTNFCSAPSRCARPRLRRRLLLHRAPRVRDPPLRGPSAAPALPRRTNLVRGPDLVDGVEAQIDPTLLRLRDDLGRSEARVLADEVRLRHGTLRLACLLLAGHGRRVTRSPRLAQPSASGLPPAAAVPEERTRFRPATAVVPIRESARTRRHSARIGLRAQAGR